MGSLLLVVTLGEVALRLRSFQLLPYKYPDGYYVANEQAGYRLARDFPETLIVSRGGTQDVCVTNRLGVRDVELPDDQDPRKIVLVLGASYTYGWGLPRLELTWPRRLDAEIEERFPELRGFHFVNAGVPGYNLFQVLALYEQVLDDVEAGFAILVYSDAMLARNRFGPAGAFTVFNGVVMGHEFEQSLRGLPSRLLGNKLLDVPHDTLLEASAIYFHLFSYATRFVDPDSSNESPPNGWESLSRVMRRFQNISRKHGVTPLVAYLPFSGSFDHQETSTTAAGREVASRFGIPFLDPKEAMRPALAAEGAHRTLTHGYDYHYSARGNRVYAEALAPLVADRLRLGGPGGGKAEAAGRRPNGLQ